MVSREDSYLKFDESSVDNNQYNESTCTFKKEIEIFDKEGSYENNSDLNYNSKKLSSSSSNNDFKSKSSFKLERAPLNEPKSNSVEIIEPFLQEKFQYKILADIKITKNNKSFVGKGFFIADSIIFTAAHNLIIVEKLYEEENAD